MDQYSGKKTGDTAVVSRKGSSLVLRDTANNRDRNSQFCNRIGCSGRLNSAKSTHISCSDKAKSSRPSFRSSSNAKEIVGCSSRTPSATNNPRKSMPGPRKKLSSQPERESSEAGGCTDDAEVPESVPPPGKIQKGLHSESDDSGSSENMSMEVGSSSVSSTRFQRRSHQNAGLGKSDTGIGSPVSVLSKSASQGARAGPSRYGIRKLRCSSISDVVPTRSSTPDSNLNRQKDTIRKRNCEGESSSSARGKKISGPSFEGRSSSSSSGVTITESRSRNVTASRDNGAASVRTRKTVGYTRSRAANQGSGNNLSPNEPQRIPQMCETITPIDSDSPSSSHQFSMGSPLSRSRAYGLPGTNTSESLRRIRPSSPAEVGNMRSSNRESFRRYNMDGIAEVLLALERIEQDEELSYEQLLVLETSLFLNGLNFYDQHRDMRLDIDNMSYEELLALEERMGNVSTALAEDKLSECLKTCTYQSAYLENGSSKLSGETNDVKCSICQEEYAIGEEMGMLHCEHKYHSACIQQWLRLKNWCPICKTSVACSSSSSPPPSSHNQ
ncbi:E3 ubiquitin-protein ligase MBR2-like isoform X2 [Mercurialis annua]|uniref:E3 ubiquitin-protein ligase MBR2-like isoform X2 n=1 Tax=Mercurialis annua TaxID=3986 RepID=UPI00215DE954|nr:E3 ubiquitin-protein ligase MBR2-like isoform X2 [Mercurialis annua]